MATEADPSMHRFIQRTKAKPLASEVTKLAVCILNHYSRRSLTVNRYRKMGPFVLNDRNSGAPPAGPFRFDDFVSHIRDSRSFDHTLFHLPPLLSVWLDAGPVFSINSSIFVSDVEGPLPLVTLPFGESFPIKPSIDREGVAFGTFQTALQENIVRLFHQLVDASHLALEVSGLDWFHCLRMIINDCVTIVDITLHQLYYKAEYLPKAHWKFDRAGLKKRNGMRIMDKFNWIGKITGRGLDDAVEEKKRFRLLKNIRNHMNHFDPPCFAFTLKDAEEWLSHVPHIGRLLWKMRMKMDEPPTRGIVEMITLPVVAFVSRNESDPPFPQERAVGYSSSTWPRLE